MKRIRKKDREDATVGRSNFQRDFDRIVFSSAFRRLQDKTQVFPLAKSDFVRTRLTHSLEVSCIGRSLGTEVGIELHGCFQAEKVLFDETAKELGLVQNSKSASWYCRHPLTFLVEAADDICCRVIDFEDGFRLKHVTLEEAQTLLMGITGKGEVETKVKTIDSDADKIGCLRRLSMYLYRK